MGTIRRILLRQATLLDTVVSILVIGGILWGLLVAGLNCSKNAIAQEVDSGHLNKTRFEVMHKPLLDTVCRNSKRLDKVERAQKRTQSLFFAQFSDADIERLSRRADDIEKRDSLFQ